MTYRILYGPVQMNSASADPGVTAYWVFSSVRTLTHLPPPSPPPPHLFLWSGPENDQHSESNGKLKTLSFCFICSELCWWKWARISRRCTFRWSWASASAYRLSAALWRFAACVITHPCLHPCLLQRGLKIKLEQHALIQFFWPVT